MCLWKLLEFFNFICAMEEGVKFELFVFHFGECDNIIHVYMSAYYTYATINLLITP